MPQVIADALDSIYGGDTPIAKVAKRARLTGEGRVNASDVWAACDGIGTHDAYRLHLDGKKKQAEEDEKEKASKRAEREAKARAAPTERRQLAESHWKLMGDVQYDEALFPKATPKILGRESCIALLETRYGEAHADLVKQKQPELLAKMKAKLIVVRPRQRRQRR